MHNIGCENPVAHITHEKFSEKEQANSNNMKTNRGVPSVFEFKDVSVLSVHLHLQKLR